MKKLFIAQASIIVCLLWGCFSPGNQKQTVQEPVPAEQYINNELDRLSSDELVAVMQLSKKLEFGDVVPNTLRNREAEYLKWYKLGYAYSFTLNTLQLSPTTGERHFSDDYIYRAWKNGKSAGGLAAEIKQVSSLQGE